MDNINFKRSFSLNNIPQKKANGALLEIENSDDDLKTKNIKSIAINRYIESNIPIEYWHLKMEKDFKGDPRLLKKYEDYVADISKSYHNGSSICFAGNLGNGKTMTLTSIIKKACLKGYSCLYTSLSDVVNVLTTASYDDKFDARRELVMVDFLVLDECDIRYFNQSDSANDLFARYFESIIRTRLQNKLPILMATNSPNFKEGFVSLFKDSIGSLMSKIPIFTVMPGSDFRKLSEANK